MRNGHQFCARWAERLFRSIDLFGVAREAHACGAQENRLGSNDDPYSGSQVSIPIVPRVPASSAILMFANLTSELSPKPQAPKLVSLCASDLDGS